MLEKKAKLIKKNAPKPATKPIAKKLASPSQIREQWLSEKKAKSDQVSELRRKLFGR